MEKKTKTWNPEQQFLLPPSVQDFVPKGHLAHFIRNVVLEELDLRTIEGEYTETRGAPPYSPGMMVALLLYSYCQGVYSSREISKACEERLDFMAVTAMNAPKFRAIAGFRKRHIESLGELFLQVLKMCQEAKLVKLQHVAIDGTRIKANASIDKTKTYQAICKEEENIKKSVAEWLRKGAEEDETEDEEYGEDGRGDELPAWVSNKEERRKRFAEARESMEKRARKEAKEREQAEATGIKPKSKLKKRIGPNPQKGYNFTDPESELQRTRRGYIQGYNAQVAVDANSYVICTRRYVI